MPFLFAAGGIERKQALVSGTQVKGVAHFNRRHFIGDFTRIVRLLHIASTEHPGFFQIMDVIGVNLFQRRKALTFLITTIGRPVLIGNGGDSFSRCGIGA